MDRLQYFEVEVIQLRSSVAKLQARVEELDQERHRLQDRLDMAPPSESWAFMSSQVKAQQDLNDKIVVLKQNMGRQKTC